MEFDEKVKALLPEDAKKVLRFSYHKVKFWNNKLTSKVVDKDQIKADLRKIGLHKGCVALVHSSLSSVGYVRGGADAVIDALLEIVGEKGTVVVPTFPFRGFMADYVQNSPAFDVDKTPSKMGAVTERFRQRPGSIRSAHPTHSVAAIGAHAPFLIEGHEDSLYPFDEASPFWKLIKIKGYVLLLGVGYESMTVLRTFECIVPDFPYRVYLEEPIKLPVVNTEGQEKSIMTKVQNPQVSKIRSNSIIGGYLDKCGVSRIGSIGMATARLVFVGDLLDIMNELLKKGITTYRPVEDEKRELFSE